MEPLIEVAIKSVVFPGQVQPALRDIRLEIERGEFVVITGPVASGKSTLCHCLTGAIPLYYPAQMEGRVAVAGCELQELALPQVAGIIGYMMQDPQNQIVSASVRDDVAFGPGNLCLPRPEVNRRVEEALKFVGLGRLADRTPDALSGGEAQRVVLAGILALHPQLLVLDKPTAELDPEGRRDIVHHLGLLNRAHHTTIIMVADQLSEALPHASRVLVMEQGTVVKDVTAIEYRRRRNGFRQEHACCQKKDSCLQDSRKALASMEGCSYVYPGGQVGCDGIDLKLYQGELVALIGLNGSGKTTVAKHFNGLIQPTSGTVRVFGQKITRASLQWCRQRIGYLFQNPDNQIFANSVFEEAAFGLRIQKVPKDQVSERVTEVLTRTGLVEHRDSHPHRLSRGQRQLLALASILVTHPELIIADEPTTGLDHYESKRIMHFLDQLVAGGCAVLMVTHDLYLARCHAHRLVAMNDKRIILDIPGGEIDGHMGGLSKIGLDFSQCLPDMQPFN